MQKYPFLLSVLVIVLLVITGSTSILKDPDFTRLLSELNTAGQTLGASNVASPAPSPVTAGEEVVVIRIIDGDTIELADGRTLRYIGIDTPETRHPQKGVECYGKEATEFNRWLVEGKSVRLEKDVSETDRYGRLLRYVWVGDIFVNQELVQQGYAHSSSYPPDISKQSEFLTAEQLARQTKLGLWNACP